MPVAANRSASGAAEGVPPSTVPSAALSRSGETEEPWPTACGGRAFSRKKTASIADNAVKNRYRARGRFRRIFAASADAPASPEPIETARGPEEQAGAGEARRFVAEALKLLPAEFRMPVVLRDLEEWSYEEIATSLDLPVGTVKSRISRGRGQLKTLLAPLMDSGKTWT